eukprot:TRINITY_DN7349_c0_g2_i1.p1 TRINITY_DN7349_c0_g2~~TRINITY_DN7349_c0_g2_i1.p1  ORF type:complete len:345 (+),score=50.19 TRINITY_DN7349_c0_g2_i1:496-1530(+)
MNHLFTKELRYKTFEHQIKQCIETYDGDIRKCKNNCPGGYIQYQFGLLNQPNNLVFNLIWPVQNGRISYTQKIFDIIVTELDISEVFGYTPSNSGYYILNSIVCFSCSHYYIYMKKSNNWVLFNDSVYLYIGSWNEVIIDCKKRSSLPCLLMYRKDRNFSTRYIEPLIPKPVKTIQNGYKSHFYNTPPGGVLAVTSKPTNLNLMNATKHPSRFSNIYRDQGQKTYFPTINKNLLPNDEHIPFNTKPVLDIPGPEQNTRTFVNSAPSIEYYHKPLESDIIEVKGDFHRTHYIKSSDNIIIRIWKWMWAMTLAIVWLPITIYGNVFTVPEPAPVRRYQVLPSDNYH